jgi:hypothetical protein
MELRSRERPSWQSRSPSRSGFSLWRSRSRSSDTRVLGALGVVLVGYAMWDGLFAYLGAPPLFVGEAVLALGLFARRLPMGSAGPSCDRPLGLAMTVFALWGLSRTFALHVGLWCRRSARCSEFGVTARSRSSSCCLRRPTSTSAWLEDTRSSCGGSYLGPNRSHPHARRRRSPSDRVRERCSNLEREGW